MKIEILYRQITATIFFAALLAQTFSNSFIIADYYTNTNAYAKNCENKDKLQMHCNGKCQMMKKLQQEENKDKQNPEKKPENKNEITLSSKSFFVTINQPFIIITSTSILSPSSDGKSIDRSTDIFHPPKT